MIRIDANLLEELGLGQLPTWEQNLLLGHIYDTLETRVGIRLADQMTSRQLDEFEAYFEARDDEGAYRWLEANFPNYKSIVQEEHSRLTADIAAVARRITELSRTEPMAQGVVPKRPCASEPEPGIGSHGPAGVEHQQLAPAPDQRGAG